MTYPRIRVSGDAHTRGRQYGQAARERIVLSLTGYATVFETRFGTSWSALTRESRGYREAIADVAPSSWAEIEGIAAGAGVEVDDILALNTRTEIMARHAGGQGATSRPEGCTSLVVLPERTQEGRLLLAENWDWLAHTVSTVIVLEVQQDEGPSFVTVVEAGLLAKVGMNSAGLAIGTNFLRTERDGVTDGVPYHVVLRALHDAETLPEAHAALQTMPRASSANYLLGHADGVAVDIEAEPGGWRGLTLAQPSDGLLVHTNHFAYSDIADDVCLLVTPDSPFRKHRAESLAESSTVLDVARVTEILGDHANFPVSVCSHSDPRLPPEQRETTAFGVVMEPATGTIHLADGNPCAAPWRQLAEATDLLSRARPAGRMEQCPALLA